MLLAYFLQPSVIYLATISSAMLLAPADMLPVQNPDLNLGLGGLIQPNQYEVVLEKGYSIEEHFRTIGIDLSASLIRLYDDLEAFTSVSYIIRIADSANLDLIRRDSQVRTIALHALYRMIEKMDHEYEERAIHDRQAAHQEL